MSEPAPPPVSRSLLDVLSRYLPWLLFVLAALLSLVVLRRRARASNLPSILELEDAEAGLQSSLEELIAGGGDPAEQITAAYRRLLSALTRAGAPRRLQEAPHEHLFRVLGPLGARPEPLHRLAALHVMAEFSGRSVIEEHRAAAMAALEESLATLRETRHEDVPGKSHNRITAVPA